MHGDVTERIQTYEATRIVGIVVTIDAFHRGNVFIVERAVTYDPRSVVALVESEANCASDSLLRVIDESLKGFTLRSIPEPVVD